MEFKQVVDILRFTSPVFMQLICIFLLIRSYDWNKEPSRKKLTILLVLTKICSIITWLGILAYTYFPAIFIKIHCLYFICMLLNSVFFFHFVYILTQGNKHRQFSYIHYAIPLVIVGTLTIWSLFIPSEVKMYIITHNGEAAKGYELYSKLFISKMPINAIYYIGYMIWEFVRLHSYRKAVINYSADIATASLRWLYIFMFTSLLAIPLIIGSAIIPREHIFGSLFIVIPIILVMFQGIIVTYNMIVGRYVIISEETNNIDNKNIKNTVLLEHLEKYMEVHKPHLNPKLKITDLSAVLMTNRSRLSQLINQHYKMNFSCWINNYRLREFNALSENSNLSRRVLAEKVGFSDYRTLLRFEKKQCGTK